MRRLAAVGLAFWVACGLAAAPLRVGIEPNTSPLSLHDPHGKPTGLAVEIIEAIARDQKLEIEFVTKNWADILADFRTGRLDVLAACGRNPEREEFMRFSVPHIDLGTGVFVGSTRPPPADLADLGRRTIGTTRESLASDYARQQKWPLVKDYRSMPEALAAVERGECEAIIGSSIVIAHYIRTTGYRRITQTDLVLPGLTYELHMAVQPAAHALLFKLNLGLAHLRANGTYDQIHERWIGPLQPRRLRLKDVRPYLLIFALLASGGIAAFLWQRRLLLRLARQTAALGQREEQLSLVLEGSNDGFWDWDLRTGTIVRSERWASMLGYTLAEIEPSPAQLGKLTHPDDLHLHEKYRSEITHGTTDHVEAEYRLRAKSGEWIWVLDRGKVVVRDPAGHPLRIAGTHTDITERKRTAAALAESQALLDRSAHLLEQTQAVARIGGWEVDLRTDHLFWTTETHRIHETVPGEFPLTVEKAIQFYAPESRPLITAAVEQLIRDGTPFELELELITARQRRLPVHATGRAETAQGRVVKIYGSFRDLTTERAEREEREKLRLKMLEAQKLESLGVLAGGIAHDFNNLLTAILANSSLLRETATGPDAESLAQIETAAQRAADLCRQMLAYAGRGSFVVEYVDLSALVRATAQLLHVSLSKKARLILRLADDLPSVEADAAQVRQVIMNLVMNASEALGATAGEIHLTTCRGRPEDFPRASLVHSFDLPATDCVCLEASDNGAGMAPTTLARIFDPFFTTKFAGRGLGLPAVLGIVRAHHGALSVESSLGAGSTFRLFLPAAQATTPIVPAAPRPAAHARPSGQKILLADDEPIVLAAADSVLRHHGYQTVLAADGHEAVHQFGLAPHSFALVLLDLTMPGLDGAEVLRHIRALHPAVRVLIMSGYGEQHILAQLRGQGDVIILRKPFTLDILLARVAETLAV